MVTEISSFKHRVEHRFVPVIGKRNIFTVMTRIFAEARQVYVALDECTYMWC